MVSFESDYVAGAHPEILKRLTETNLEPLPGYGADPYCESAREKLRAAIGRPDAEIEFLVGGTQANAAVISTMLAGHEGVIAATTGHIGVHEAGAVEFTGHKVLGLPHRDGKIDPAALEAYLTAFYADPSHDHMVFPGMVYLSHPTEYGTLYSKRELTALSEICRRFGAALFLDGARLGYGLMSGASDLTLPELAGLCDVFTVGGTKMGALCGEAVVFPRGGRPAHFTTLVKQRGALLAKGRLLGVQFDALFTDDLYFRIGRYAIDMADRLKGVLASHGLTPCVDSPTNQQFVLLDDGTVERLQERIAFSFWERADDTHTVVRFVTSWSTTPGDLLALDEALSACLRPQDAASGA